MEADQQHVNLVEKGHLEGHNGWVTCIATGHSIKENEDTQVLISGSRDKTIIIWKFNPESKSPSEFAKPWKCLTGHSHFVSDICLSSDNNHLLSASWDRSLRLWDLAQGKSTERFVGHTKEVLSCSFSSDNRQILSGGADKTIKLWNVKGVCRFTEDKKSHSDWVSNVRFLGRSTTKGNFAGSFFASTGWDGRLKIWNNQSFEIKDSFKAHDGNINAITTSPKGTYIVTGGKDKKVKVWDFNDCSKAFAEFDAGANVTSLSFNPKTSWIAIGTENGVKVWDFENKENPLIAETAYEIEYEAPKVWNVDEKGEKKKRETTYHQCTSVQWNSIGSRLFAGFTNGVIKVYETLVESAN